MSARDFYIKLHLYKYRKSLYTSNTLISFTSYTITSITSFFKIFSQQHMFLEKKLLEPQKSAPDPRSVVLAPW